MPTRKNSFRGSDYIEQTILDEDGGIVGTIRVNPVAVKWKPCGAHKFLTISLTKFTNWITDENTGAHRTKS